MDNEAKSIGELALNVPQIATFSANTLTPVRRIDDAEINALRVIATAELPAVIPVNPEHLAKCLRFLGASLAHRIGDDLGEEIRYATFRRYLGGMPKEQIDWLSNQIMLRFKWFPTISEVLEVAREWERPDMTYRDKARSQIAREMQIRMEEAMAAMKARTVAQAEIDALPDKWKRIAEDRGYLRRTADGFEVRHEPKLIDDVENERGESGGDEATAPPVGGNGGHSSDART